jgi:oligopeptide transport system permease protein
MTTAARQKNALQTTFARRERSLWGDAWKRLARNRAAVLGMIMITGFALIAIFAPWLAPHGPLEIFPQNSFRPPMWIHSDNPARTGDPSFPLGTDSVGRDVLSRLLYGTRVSLVVGIIPLLPILILGISVGLLAGYAGGKVDNLLMRFTDVVYAFPGLLFFIIMMTALRDTTLGKMLNGLLLLFVSLSLVAWVGVARLVRGQVLSLKEKEFVEAAQMVGANTGRIMLRHLLPNSIGPIIVAAAFLIPNSIITEATLGFLGLGLRPPTDPHAIFPTSWGSLCLEGYAAITSQPYLLLAPAVCIALMTLAFTFVGDGLRDALDPRTIE